MLSSIIIIIVVEVVVVVILTMHIAVLAIAVTLVSCLISFVLSFNLLQLLTAVSTNV